MNRILPPLLSLALLVATAPARAQEDASNLSMAEESVVTSSSFLEHHPDLQYRVKGMQAYERDAMPEAYEFFRKAARYGDKASQAMVAEMLWEGRGVAQDRALAYAWIDLAGERGYRVFVSKRERYWKQLDAATQERAVSEGVAVYAEFGDVVAQPRIEAALRRGRSKFTGSRVGGKGSLRILIPGPSGWVPVPTEVVYSDKFWQPDDYFAWQDQVWRQSPRGVVEVGALGADSASTDNARREP